MKALLFLLLSVPGIAVAQGVDPAQLWKGEAFGTFGGSTANNIAQGLPFNLNRSAGAAFSVGAAVNVFHRPNFPLVFEYVGASALSPARASVERDGLRPSASSWLRNANSRLNYFGGGLRFGGTFFGSVTGGFRKFNSVVTSTVVHRGTNQPYQCGIDENSGDPILCTDDPYTGNFEQRLTSTKVGLSFAGGANVPIMRSWGLRVEVRTTSIQGAQRWLYGVSGGTYYRLGKGH